MAERFYTVNGIDVEGEDFTLEGLQATLDAIRERWGGKEHKPQTVSPAMSLGGGACILAVEDGRVMLIRDDAARALAKAREATETEPDGRKKIFHAAVTIGRRTGSAVSAAEHFADGEVSGEGLMGLLFQAAMFVQDRLGGAPECMSYEECLRRENSIRAQVSRARGQSRDLTGVHFPSSEIGSFFEAENRPGEFYHVIVSIKTGNEQAASGPPEAPELPRRA